MGVGGHGAAGVIVQTRIVVTIATRVDSDCATILHHTIVVCVLETLQNFEHVLRACLKVSEIKVTTSKLMSFNS